MDVQIIDIPKITDPRGNLAVIEKDTIPFDMQRVYYLYDVPSSSHRGGHAQVVRYVWLWHPMNLMKMIISEIMIYS